MYDNSIVEGATGPKNPQSSGILTPQEIEEIKLKVHVKEINKRLKESQDAANQIRNRYQIVVQELQWKEDQLKQEKLARTKKKEDVKNLKEKNLALQSEKDNRIHWQDRATDLSNKLAKVTSVKESEYEEINKILCQVIVERDQEREQNRDRLAKQVDKTLEAKEQLLLATQERDRLRSAQLQVEVEGKLGQGIEQGRPRDILVGAPILETPLLDSILRTPTSEEGTRPFPPWLSSSLRPHLELEPEVSEITPETSGRIKSKRVVFRDLSEMLGLGIGATEPVMEVPWESERDFDTPTLILRNAAEKPFESLATVGFTGTDPF